MSRAVVLVASTRAAAGAYEDRCGPVIEEWLAERGFGVSVLVRADGEDFAQTLAAEVAGRPNVVITSGGTGISPTDRTPEATKALLDYEIPGLADAIRRSGEEKVPTAVLSRGVAGVVGRTLVVNLPGSLGGVKDGLAVLDAVLAHALEQLAGGEHDQMSALDVSAKASFLAGGQQ